MDRKEGEWMRQQHTEGLAHDTQGKLEPYLLAEIGNPTPTREVLRIAGDLGGLLADVLPAEQREQALRLLRGLQEAQEERLLSFGQSVRGQGLVDGAMMGAALRMQDLLTRCGITVQPSPTWAAPLERAIKEVGYTDQATRLSEEARFFLGELTKEEMGEGRWFGTPFADTPLGAWKRRAQRVPREQGSVHTMPLVVLPHLQGGVDPSTEAKQQERDRRLQETRDRLAQEAAHGNPEQE